MRRQKQIDESKQMIARALVDLLREHDFHELTLSQVAAHARVTRMTLYRHFKTKEMIILYLAQKSLDEQRAELREKGEPMKELISQRLERIKNLPHLAKLLLSRDLEELLSDFRMASHKEQFEALTGLRFEDDPMLFHFFFGGINSMIRAWIRDGCRASSRELAEQIVSVSQAFIDQRIRANAQPYRTP